MKQLTLSLFFLISSTTIAQELDLITKKENTRTGKATYTVLKDNPEIKHGDYVIKSYTGNKKILVGQYKQGKKTGLWYESFYGFGFKGLKCKGEFLDDQKVGEWIYFGYNNDTSQIYNHTLGKMVFNKLATDYQKEYWIKTDTGKYKSILDFPPTFIGGNEIFNDKKLQSLDAYPRELQTPKIDAFKIDAIVSFFVRENGEISDIEIDKPIGYGYEEKIINLIKNAGEWSPGVKNGKKVAAQASIPIKMRYTF
ncbi:MAG: hypothetical protein U0V04_05190 [Spirosomataceae bacterium]|jgi:hypothetical protein